MAEEHLPIALADAHAPVDKCHVPTAVVHRSARTRAEEINQQLFLALDTVFPAVRPETAKLRIGLEPREQIIRYRRNRIVPTEALIERLLRFAHRLLLMSQCSGRWCVELR